MPTTCAARDLYFDLLKRSLLDEIHADDPLAHYVPYQEKGSTPAWKRTVIRRLEQLLHGYRLGLVERHWMPWAERHARMSPEQLQAERERDLYYPARCHTLIGRRRLDNIQQCVETVVREGIPGDVIETGVWRGGACIFMKAVLQAYGDTTRSVWVADSFEGLPPPDAQYPADTGDHHHEWSDYFAVSKPEVEENFRRYGLLDEHVKFLVGWFKDTLPTAPIERLAVMRLDGDMYEATIQAMESLYPRLSPQGFVIVDDYYLAPCAKAIHDFRDVRGIRDEIQPIDGRGVFWRRSDR
jgi:O-methyltransferase